MKSRAHFVVKMRTEPSNLLACASNALPSELLCPPRNIPLPRTSRVQFNSTFVLTILYRKQRHIKPWLSWRPQPTRPLWPFSKAPGSGLGKPLEWPADDAKRIGRSSQEDRNSPSRNSPPLFLRRERGGNVLPTFSIALGVSIQESHFILVTSSAPIFARI
jgi:hypothetical protein